MKKITKVLTCHEKVNGRGDKFFLATVLLDDDEIYTLAHDRPPKEGDKVYAFFDEKYNKPKAVYP